MAGCTSVCAAKLKASGVVSAIGVVTVKVLLMVPTVRVALVLVLGLEELVKFTRTVLPLVIVLAPEMKEPPLTE